MHVGCAGLSMHPPSVPQRLQEPAELPSTFAGCSLRQAACFLRLVYSPDHATAASLGALNRADAVLLPALVRLAHRLDAAALLDKLEACLQGKRSLRGWSLLGPLPCAWRLARMSAVLSLG